MIWFPLNLCVDLYFNTSQYLTIKHRNSDRMKSYPASEKERQLYAFADKSRTVFLILLLFSSAMQLVLYFFF